MRVVTGADDLASAGAIARRASGSPCPIGLAGLGGLWSERAGVVNIGLEGMMILGTWGGAFGAYYWGPWAGVLGAIVGGALGGLLHAVATVTFGVDHIVSGVAINIIGRRGQPSSSRRAVFSAHARAAARRSRRHCRSCPTVTLPGLSDALGNARAAALVPGLRPGRGPARSRHRTSPC